MAEIIKLGSLYINETPVATDSEYRKGTMIIGNTVRGMELSFIRAGNILVSDHIICPRISWTRLNKFGYIFGKEILIDGQPYLCRSLKVGDKAGTLSEWDSILDKIGETDSLLYWHGKYFWGQETAANNAAHRVLRGYRSARCWCSTKATAQNVVVGFRPILEPLTIDLPDPADLVGQQVLVVGPNGSIAGELLDCTDYDLFLAPVPGMRVLSKCLGAAGQEREKSSSTAPWYL